MPVYSEQEDRRIAKLFENGFGVVAIAKELHHDPEYVSRALRGQGFFIQGARTLTDETEAAIAADYQNGMSQRKLANKYDTTRTVIKGALKRQGIATRPGGGQRLYTINEHAFDVINSEHVAYWTGFIYADGSVYKNSLSVSLKEADREHVATLASFLDSNRPLYHDKRLRAIKMDVTHAYLAKRLVKLGIVARRPNHVSMITATPPRMIRHLLRGFWDGDGCVGKNPNDGISFCGRLPFMEWIRGHLDVATGVGARRKISKHQTADLHYLRYSGRRVALMVINYLFDGATIWLPRKKRVIDEWPEPKPAIRDLQTGQYKSP